MSDKILAIMVKLAGSDNLSGVLRNITGVGGAAQAKLKNLTQTAKDQNKELKNLSNTWSMMGPKTKAFIDQERALQIQLEKTNAAIKNQKDGMIHLSTQQRWGENAKTSGMGNMQTGAAMAAPLAFVAKSGSDFEQGMIDIQLVGNLTDAKLKDLQGTIFDTARAAGQLPEQARLGVMNLMDKGLNSDQAAAMISPISKAATAYRAEMSDVSNVAFSNMDNLKVPITQTSQALDIMAASTNNGQVGLKSMAQHFPALTAQAQALGQHGTAAVADLSAAFQIARKGTGDDASAAGNIKNLMAKIYTKETQANFAKKGINIPQAMKKLEAEGQTPIEAIANLTKQATGGDLSKMSFLFGDMEAQSALRPLIQNMGAYKKIRQESLGAMGTVDDAFAKRSKTAGFQTMVLVGNLQKLGIIIGQRILPIMNPLIVRAGELIDKFGAWAEANPEVLGTILKVAGGIIALNLAWGAGKFALGTLLGPIAKGAQLFKALWGAGRFLLPILAGISLPVWGIIAGVAALVGVGYLLWKNWDLIKAKGLQIWNTIQLGIVKFVNWFTDLPNKMKEIGLNIVKSIGDGILSGLHFVTDAVSNISNILTNKPKKDLQIKSPSRVAMAMGGYYSEGFAGGITNKTHLALNAAKNLSKKIVTAGVIAGSVGGGFAHAGAVNSAPVYHVTININGAGANAQDIANQVRQEFEKLSLQAKIKSRSNFEDR